LIVPLDSPPPTLTPIADLRRRALADMLAEGPLTVEAIRRRHPHLAEHHVCHLLNHHWFEETDDGHRLTEAGRKEVSAD
jgi:hypothetical protein